MRVVIPVLQVRKPRLNDIHLPLASVHSVWDANLDLSEPPWGPQPLRRSVTTREHPRARNGTQSIVRMEKRLPGVPWGSARADARLAPPLQLTHIVNGLRPGGGRPWQ